MDELPPETKEFLARLGREDIETLEEGVRLVVAVRRVGKAAKWTIITLLGLLAGVVMFGESIAKIMAWWR